MDWWCVRYKVIFELSLPYCCVADGFAAVERTALQPWGEQSIRQKKLCCRGANNPSVTYEVLHTRGACCVGGALLYYDTRQSVREITKLLLARCVQGCTFPHLRKNRLRFQKCLLSVGMYLYSWMLRKTAYMGCLLHTCGDIVVVIFV